MSSVLSPNTLLNFVKIWRPVFEKWIFENLKDFTLFLVRPLPATPGGKFSGAFQGPAKRCQTPLEPRRNLLPVFSYDWLFEIFRKKSKFDRQSSEADFSKSRVILSLKLCLSTAFPSYFATTEKKPGVSDGFWHLCTPQSDPLFSLNYGKKNHKNTCEWPLRGLCMYVRWRSEYLPYAYHRGPLPPSPTKIWGQIISDIATLF